MAAAIELRPDAARAVAWAASLGAVTAQALAAHERVSIAAARGRLAAAERSGALRSWRPLRQRPALYTVTAAGLRAAGIRGWRPPRVSPAGTEHAIACCEVAVALQLRYPGCRVAGEPELRAAAGAAKPLCCVALRGPAQERSHRADLALLPPRGAAALAVEVELTVKAPRRLAAICAAWARSRDTAGVLYVVTPLVRPALERALRAARAERRIALLDLDELCALSRSACTNAVTSAP